MENLTAIKYVRSRNCSTTQPSEVVQHILIVLNLACAIATMVLNSMICIAVYRVKSLRKASNFLLVSLSVAQLLVTGDFVTQIVFLSSENIRYKLCLAMGLYHYVIAVIIILHLTAVSVDRLLAIQWHLRYSSIVTKRRMMGCVAVLWVSGLLIPFLHKLYYTNQREETKVFHKFSFGCSHPSVSYKHKWLEKKNITWYEKQELLHKAQILMILKVITNLALPFIIIVICYAVILKTSVKHYKQIKAQNLSWTRGGEISEIRAAKTIAIIIVSFVVCFLPMFVISVMQVYKRPCWGKHPALKALVLLSSLAAILNPLIYAGHNREFKEAFRKILNQNKRKNTQLYELPERNQVKRRNAAELKNLS